MPTDRRSPVRIDDQLSRYLFSYRHDGASWSFVVLAASPEDARARIAKMAYASYDGELIAELPASLSYFARIATAVRNSVRAVFST